MSPAIFFWIPVWTLVFPVYFLGLAVVHHHSYRNYDFLTPWFSGVMVLWGLAIFCWSFPDVAVSWKKGLYFILYAMVMCAFAVLGLLVAGILIVFNYGM